MIGKMQTFTKDFHINLVASPFKHYNQTIKTGSEMNCCENCYNPGCRPRSPSFDRHGIARSQRQRSGSPEKRKAVIAALKSGFNSTDQGSRSDRKNGPNILLMIVPRISSFLQRDHPGFQNNAYRHGYEVTALPVLENNPRRTEEYINLLKAGSSRRP
jgi:hypothetical protein